MKVLLIRLSSIGDVILTSSVFNALKNAGAEIDVLTDKTVAPVFVPDDRIRKVMGVNKKALSLKAIKELADVLKKERYDFVFDLHNIIKTRLLTKLLPFKTIRYRKESLWRREVIFFKFLKRRKQLFVPELYAKAVRKAGVKVEKNPTPEIFIPEEITSHMARLLPPRKFVVIAPGARWKGKAYPVRKYKKVAQILRRIGYEVVAVGGKEDVEAGMEITGAYNLNFCGRLSLLESMAVMKQADFVISNDSAAVHMARAVKTKVAVIYGATHPCFGFAPLKSEGTVIRKELPCNPCSLHGKVRCEHIKCLNIPPKEVVTKALQMMP
ncbi:glycosyltransferase family 9 protein [Desulfurobacterium sp.]